MLTRISFGMAQNFWTLTFVLDLMKTRLDFFLSEMELNPGQSFVFPLTLINLTVKPQPSMRVTPEMLFSCNFVKGLFPLVTDLLIANILPCLSVSLLVLCSCGCPKPHKS